MKLSPHFLTAFLAVILTFGTVEGTSQTQTFNMTDVESPFVVIQLKSLSSELDSAETAKAVKGVVDQIKAINTKLGFEQSAKKISSTILESKGKKTPYLAIRNFENFTAAEKYSQDIRKEIPGDTYGEIAEPFTISKSNYKICVTEKDFDAYYKIYSGTKK